MTGKTGHHPAPFGDSSADPRDGMTAQALAKASRNGFPIVAGHVQRGDRLGTLAGVACALLLGGAAFWGMSSQRVSPVAPPAAPASPATKPPAPVVKTASPPMAAPPVAPADAMEIRMRAPALILDIAAAESRPASAAPAAATAAAAPASAPRGSQQPLSADESFAERIGNSGSDTVTATRLADPAHTVIQGTLIAAVLETAIDSDLPGFARAVVSQDIRSFDGSRVLIPRASRLVGQYKSGVANGQKRAYVLWSRLIRPDGASIALASPATDFAGNTGLAGEVDTHFFARFGSAILLSVVDVLAAVGSASVVISGSQSAAAVAVQRDSQIPPTIKVPQGSPIRVFTARDLDFSGVTREAAAK
jgi:type IV secretion system protein VirB10